VGGQNHAPAALPRGKGTGVHFVRTWVGLRAAMEGCGKPCNIIIIIIIIIIMFIDCKWVDTRWQWSFNMVHMYGLWRLII